MHQYYARRGLRFLSSYTSFILPAFLRFACLLIALAGIPSFACRAQSLTSAPAEQWVRIEVSRREMRVEFRTDNTRGWGWPASSENYRRVYAWSVDVPGMDEPRTLGAWVSTRTRGARKFGSLEEVVKAADPVNCGSGMMPTCEAPDLRATGRNDVVTLTLRDSAQIARLFGMRPTFLHASEHRPDSGDRSTDSARVEYVEPLIPAPDAKTRADFAQSRRRFEERINLVTRFIDGGNHGSELWLVVGDSLPLRVNESHCAYDFCVVGLAQVADSGWSVDDPRVARLLALSDNGEHRSLLQPARYLEARRPGTTTVRARGLHSPSDTAASRRPPAREVQRTVVVTLPIARVRIEPRPDTVVVVAFQRLLLTARVFDVNGDSVAGVPVRFDVEGIGTMLSSSLSPTWLDFGARGRKRIVARAEGHADTLTVTVVDSADVQRRR